VKISKAGLELIKSFESCELEAYPDPASQLGKELTRLRLPMREYRRIPGYTAINGSPWTIGFGSTWQVYEGQIITQIEANRRLQSDVEGTESGIDRFIKIPLSSNQYDALVSLAFNIGVTALRTSTLMKKLNGGDLLGAADQFLVWKYAQGKVLQGLLNRRKMERALFLKGC
jgi:lysozyme